MFLTATGAWFTAKAETETQDAASYSWTIADFINLTATRTGDAFSAQAYTFLDMNTDGDLEDAGDKVEVANNGLLHPGDIIEFADGQTISISASDATHNFYYVVIVDGSVVVGAEGANNAKLYTAGDPVKLYEFTVSAAAATGTGASLLDGPTSKVYTVNAENTVKTDAGKTITLSAGDKSVEIRAIQKNNQTAADAYTFLMGASGEAIVADSSVMND